MTRKRQLAGPSRGGRSASQRRRKPSEMEGFVPIPERFAEQYRAAGLWAGRTLWQCFEEWAEAAAAKTALVSGTQRLTYAELADRAARLSRGLAGIGIGKGDRVVVQLPNTSGFVELVLALF